MPRASSSRACCSPSPCATLTGQTENNPVTVCPVNGIVFGERRYRASVIAGRDEIPAIVTELSDEEAEEMAITENLQRKDVTPVEEAAA